MKLFLAILFSVSLSANAAIFSVAQFGDLHAPNVCSYSNLQVAQSFILAHTNDGTYNFVGVMSPGDLMEQDTNYWFAGGANYFLSRVSLTQFTNWWQTFTSNGLFSIMSPGNHDDDGVQGSVPKGGWKCNSTNLLWNSVFPISFFSSQPGYVGSRFTNDSTSLIFAYTNGAEKFLFLTTRWTAITNTPDPFLCYTDQVAWVTSTASLYPNHNVIVQSHFLLDAYAVPDTNDLLGVGVIYISIGFGSIPFTNGWQSVPNLMLCVSGHTQPLYSGHYSLTGTAGNQVDVSCFNMQDEPDSASFFRVWTFNTGQRNVTANTYSLASGGYLTNYDQSAGMTRQAVTLTPGFNYYLHNWAVPFATPFRCTIYNFLKR